MKFRNLTPFVVMNYSMLDIEDTEHHVAVMKIGYQFIPAGQGELNCCLRHHCAYRMNIAAR
ncbi:hypothetical protein [Xenorhabdus sp. SGI240]|uniref:hypothetical protein n=1 Tax=Xenorhabdus sp. SGI240 TaxID=3158262 RepID=UPI0032B71981